MKRELPSRYADVLVSRRKSIIVLVLVITAVVGAGAVVGTSEDRGIGQASIDSPAKAALTGIGGALLGSAATTAAGFGVLGLALSPPLHRFGVVTGLSIIYPFVACVTVLPCLLVLRERARTFNLVSLIRHSTLVVSHRIYWLVCLLQFLSIQCTLSITS